MTIRWFPACVLFFGAVLIGLLQSAATSWSQSELPPLPDRNGANGRALREGSQPAYSNPVLSNSAQSIPGGEEYQSIGASAVPGLHVVGAVTCSATATHLMSTATLSNGQQQLVLVDPTKQTLAVYHIEPSKGEVVLKSVRKFDADFTLEEFNASEPSPTTIRRNARTLGPR